MATAKRRLGPAAVLVLVGALAATACGAAAAVPAGGLAAAPAPASPEALHAVQAAAAASLAGTADVSVRLVGATVIGKSSITARGTFDFRSSRGVLTLAASGTGVREPVVFTPTAVYVRPAGGGLPPGKTWTVADFSNPEALDANFPTLIAQAETLDPAFTLSELVWGAASSAPAGADGYEVTVDLKRAVAAVSGLAAVPFGRAIASEIVALGSSVTGAAGPSATIVARVRVSGGRLVQVDLSPPGSGLGAMSLALTGFGTPVHADVPAPAQTVDILTLGPGGERENRNGGDSDGG